MGAAVGVPVDIIDSIDTASKTCNLSLSSKGLSKVPYLTLKVPTLTVLNLSMNSLATLPEHLFELESLIVLNVSSNRLRVISDSLSHLWRLQTLDLSHNLLTSLPSTINQLQVLKQLVLDNNECRDLPLTLGDCKALNILSFCHNLLAPSDCPAAIAGLVNLHTLNLSHNKLGVDDPLAVGSKAALLRAKIAETGGGASTAASAPQSGMTSVVHSQPPSAQPSRRGSNVDDCIPAESADPDPDADKPKSWRKRLRSWRPWRRKTGKVAPVEPESTPQEPPEEDYELMGKQRPIKLPTLALNKLGAPGTVTPSKPSGLSVSAAEVAVVSQAMLFLPLVIKWTTNLARLSMDDNKLHWMPREVSELVCLRVLSAAENEIRNLPDLHKCVNLEQLLMRSNRLTVFPANLPPHCLTTLDLRFNRIVGLPSSEELFRFENLVQLRVENNRIVNGPTRPLSIRNLVLTHQSSNTIGVGPNG